MSPDEEGIETQIFAGWNWHCLRSKMSPDEEGIETMIILVRARSPARLDRR